jgi:hypothetical protein
VHVLLKVYASASRGRTARQRIADALSREDEEPA